MHTLKRGRLDELAKKFLIKIFVNGEINNKKVSADQAHKLLKSATNSNGEKTFSPEQYLSVSKKNGKFSIEDMLSMCDESIDEVEYFMSEVSILFIKCFQPYLYHTSPL